MAGKRMTLDEKIEKQKDVVVAAKDRYDAELEKLRRLQQKRLEMQGKELIKAFENSPRSMEEVLEFLKGDGEDA